MAKVYCSEEATTIVSEAMHLLGGNGYMRDYPIEKLYRDVNLNCIYEGENNYVLLLLGGLLR